MHSRARRIFTLAILLSSVWAVPGFALDLLFPFRRVEADPEKPYTLTEEHGPWLIMAASFFGDHGERQAHNLALELRSEYKLHAYVYKKGFDYGQRVIGRGIDKWGRPKRMKYIHTSEFIEVGVLVGNFESVDDSKAQKILARIKYAHPQTLSATKTNPTSQRLVGWRYIKNLLTSGNDGKRKGPMGSAFITRNPILPVEYFVNQGPDKFVLDLNKHVKYSLVNCPGNYSVRVATFRAYSTWDQREIKDIKAGKRMRSKLVASAEKAHKLTVALRQQGIEAYEFHDRSESIVAVGSFESVGQRRRDGKIEINPNVHHIMQTYSPLTQDFPGHRGVLRPRTIAGIAFDIQPLPVRVPKKADKPQYSAIGTFR